MQKKNKKIIVTGGAGYIGSHTIVELLQAGFDVVSIDNFSNSEPKIFDAIRKITGVKIKNYAVDLLNSSKVKAVFKKEKKIDGIIHFAALKSVPESVVHPLRYYKNNLGSLISVLECVQDFSVPSFVFSSSAAVYGEPKTLPVKETDPLPQPLSPYGETKAIGEEIIRGFSVSYKKCKSVCLRYFNVAGAHESLLLKKSSKSKAENVLPILIDHAKGTRKNPFMIFGGKLKTKDGTCVRDYVHVSDLARAHVLALENLFKKTAPRNDIFNLGTGTGSTVLEIVNAMRKASGVDFSFVIGSARAGDPQAVYASTKKAQQILDWKPKYTVGDMARTAWETDK